MNPLSKLIYELSKLPGVGEKSATRLAYFILNQPESYAQSLSSAMIEAKARLRYCQQCFNFSEHNQCEVCEDPKRTQDQICVVEKPSDIMPLERTATFRGTYHVLHGLISPMDGVGPDEIKMKELFQRLKSTDCKEVIFALNPSVEGEATTLYLSRLIKPTGIRVSQVAYGIPFGGSIEFTDRQTLGKAMDHRQELK